MLKRCIIRLTFYFLVTYLTLIRLFAQEISTRLVQVDGHRLSMRFAGKGSPIVVFESGLGGVATDWQKVQSEVAKFTRTVSYDRAGLDRSEDFDPPRTARERAVDIHTALQNAKLPPPYILVGQSAGGPYIRVFAHMFPEEVSGMVFVDASHEDFFDYLKLHLPKDWKKYQAVITRGLQDEGLIPAIRDEIQSFEGDLILARKAWPLPDVPVVSITAMHHPEVSKQALEIWLRTQQAWAARFPQGTHIQADNSGHDIQNEDPALVIEAIRQVVEIARKD